MNYIRISAVLFFILFFPLVCAADSLEISVDDGGSAFVQGEFFSDELTYKTGNLWKFEYVCGEAFDSVRVLLPENATVTGFSGKSSVSFQGRYMVVEWKAVEVGERLSVEYVFKNAEIKQDYLLLLVGVVILVAIIGGVFFLMKKGLFRRKKISEKQEAMMRGLNSNEKAVVNALRKHGALIQKKLLQETALSQATLSRTVKLLEEKGIVETVTEGYSKRIQLKEF